MSSASPAGDFLAEKDLNEIIHKAVWYTLGCCLAFYLRSDLPAQLMQHKFIRIFVIKSASLIIQKLAFFLHFFLDPACRLGILGFHQSKLLLLYPFPVIKSGIRIRYIEWKKSVIVHKFLLFFPFL